MKILIKHLSQEETCIPMVIVLSNCLKININTMKNLTNEEYPKGIYRLEYTFTDGGGIIERKVTGPLIVATPCGYDTMVDKFKVEGLYTPVFNTHITKIQRLMWFTGEKTPVLAPVF